MIPNWLWEDHATPDRLDDEELAAVSDLLGTLSNEARLRIVETLAGESPLTYTELQSRAAIADNGRLNYHLRQLDGLLVQGERGYELTERGRNVAERFVFED